MSRRGSERPLVGINLLYVRPGYMGGTVRYAYELLRHFVHEGRYRLIVYLQADAFPMDHSVFAGVVRREFRIVFGLAGRVAVEHGVLPWVAQQDGVDLLFSPGFVSPLWGRFRKVVTIHDLYYIRFPQFVRPWQRRYWQIFVPASLRAADAIITDSDSTRADVAEAFPWTAGKVARIHLGSDIEVGQSRGQSPVIPPFCLVVGNITPNKNVGVIVSALLLLKARNISCRLVVAGSDLFGILSALLDEIDVNLDIVLLEHISDEALAALYQSAICLIQASRYEGFGLPVVEAMAVGCPVIASDIAVLREVGGDGALYFSENSAESLASALVRVMNDSRLREELVEAGKDNALKFKWKKVAEQTANLFDDVLASSFGH